MAGVGGTGGDGEPMNDKQTVVRVLVVFAAWLAFFAVVMWLVK